jgi:hypothetical protein
MFRQPVDPDSTTPLTDAQAFWVSPDWTPETLEVVPADYARSLERRLCLCPTKEP